MSKKITFVISSVLIFSTFIYVFGFNISNARDESKIKQNKTKNIVLCNKINQNSIGILSTTKGIDVTEIGSSSLPVETNLCTVPEGKTVIVTSAIIRVSDSKKVTQGPSSVWISTNGWPGNIFYGIANFSSLGISGDAAPFYIRPSSSAGYYGLDDYFTQVKGGETIKIGVVTPAQAEKMIISVDLIGYVIDED